MASVYPAPALHVDVVGVGPDVILIHGWGSSSRMWRRTAGQLALAGFRAWSIDLPGSGKSQPAAPPHWYTLPNLAGAVCDLADRHDIHRAVIAGHSMGGAIALEIAHQRPDLVHALMLAAPAVSGKLGWGMHRVLRTGLGGRLLDLARQSAASTAGARLLNGMPRLLPHPVLRRDAEDLACTAPEAIAGHTRAVIGFDFTERLGSIAVPALIVVGTWDLTLPPSEAELAAARIPGARLIKMKRVRHQPVDERPQEFDRLLIGFVQDHLPR